MATFLFWNVYKKPNAKLIRDLCDENNVDVLALAECGDGNGLLPELNAGRLRLFRLVQNVATRVCVFSKYPPSQDVEVVSDDWQVSVRRIVPPVGSDVILVAIHLGSKMHQRDIDQISEAVRLSQIITSAERRVGHSRTIVMGDLNMSPFEAGMVTADGLHAVMDRRIARLGSRTVNRRKRTFFYNPMWNFLGDASKGPPGTYFRWDSSHTCYFWNMFDQVLLRPELLPHVPDDGIRIVHSIQGTSLLGANGRIDTDVSDHLPIIATIELERV